MAMSLEMSSISSEALFKVFTFQGEAFSASKREHRKRTNIGKRGRRSFIRDVRYWVSCVALTTNVSWDLIPSPSDRG